MEDRQCIHVKKKSTQNGKSLVQMLFYRQLGSRTSTRYGALPCFSKISPECLNFSIHEVLPLHALEAGHVFLGFTKCGRFLLSYTYTMEGDFYCVTYHYRLHYWLFIPYQQCRKVAEVSLFGEHALYDHFTIAVCQWPNDYEKILVYGRRKYESQDQQSQEFCYLTVTTVPSVNACKQCMTIAASYEEEDIAAGWDSCVRLSCLRHGMTLHTALELVSPFPQFDPHLSLRYDGAVVINTGNFLHVLSATLETLSPKSDPPGDISTSTSDVEACCENIGESCSNTESLIPKPIVNVSPFIAHLDSQNPFPVPEAVKTRPSFIVPSDHRHSISNTKDHDAKVTLGLEEELLSPGRSETFRSPQPCCSLAQDSPLVSEEGASEEELEICVSSFFSPVRETSSEDSCSSDLSQVTPYSPQGPRLFDIFQKMRRDTIQHLQQEASKRKQAEKEYDFTDESLDNGCEKLSVFRKKRLADRKYAFSDSDEDSENIIPFSKLSRHGSEHLVTTSPSVDSNHGRQSDWLLWNGIRRKYCYSSEIGNSASELTINVADRTRSRDVTNYLLSPASDAQDEKVLRPLNRNHVPLSPMSPRDGLDPDRKQKKDTVKQETLETRLGMRSPRDQMSHDLHLLSPREKFSSVLSSSYDKNYKTSDSQVPVCCVELKRHYIEVDDELISVITDIEDDDLTSVTGYHNALPLEVHGSGYTQLQMISNTKAEKISAQCVLIRQLSFDVEQLCHAMAEKLCSEAGKKYWCCSNYDVEIVEVCPDTGNVTAVTVMLVQATVKGTKNVRPMSWERDLFLTGFKLLWSLQSNKYKVIGSDPLTEVVPCFCGQSCHVSHEGVYECQTESQDSWHPAQEKALHLRKDLLIPTKPVKVLTNNSVFIGESLACISDPDHFVKIHLPESD